MSEIMEKTLASLPGIIANSIGSKKEGSTSRGFQNFVQNFSNMKSKHEEDQFIKKELLLQKQKLSQPSVTAGQKRESLIRLVYCHMLGYDVTFGFIHAVKLAQQGSILQKQVGYLVCSLFLHENHELVMLLINTIQKDLKSTNILEVCSALTAATRLINTEMIPALLPMVEEKTRHPKEIIRKKAIMCLHSFHLKAPGMVEHVQHLFHQALCDKDPGVMWAASHVYADLIQKDPASYQKMVPGFINILQQVIGRRLHTEYDYHSVPAPWLTIHLLKLLRLLGTGNQESSQQMYQVLKEVMQRTEPSHKMGLAVIFECLETIAAVYPHPALLEHAANCVGRFLSANNINLKYLGLKALTSVIQVNAQYALPHQAVVIECLEHADSTIRRKTLELLYKMANSANAQVICGKMLEQLDTDTDHRAKLDVVHKVCSLTERFSQSGQWYISTMNQVLLTADSLAPPSTGRSITALLAREAEKPDCDQALLEHAASVYWQLLHRDSLPETLLQVAVWVVGSQHKYLAEPSMSVVISRLCAWYGRSRSPLTQSSLLAALAKLCPELQGSQQDLVTVLQAAKSSHNKDIVQRAQELERLLRSSTDLQSTLSTPSVKKEEVDLTLTFLDQYVAESLERGERPYQPYGFRHPQPQKVKEPSTPMSGLNFLPYVSPLVNSAVTNSSSSLPVSQERAALGSGPLTASSGDSSSKEQVGLQMKGVRRVWGKEGVIKNDTSPVQQRMPVPTVKNQQTLPPATVERQAGVDATPPAVAPHEVSPEQEYQQQETRRKQDLAAQLFSGLAPSSSTAATEINTSSTMKPVPSSLTNKHGVQGRNIDSIYAANDSDTVLQTPSPSGGFDWRTHKQVQEEETTSGVASELTDSQHQLGCSDEPGHPNSSAVSNSSSQESSSAAAMHTSLLDGIADDDVELNPSSTNGPVLSLYAEFTADNNAFDHPNLAEDHQTNNIGYVPLGDDTDVPNQPEENVLNSGQQSEQENEQKDLLLGNGKDMGISQGKSSSVSDTHEQHASSEENQQNHSSTVSSILQEAGRRVIAENSAVRVHCQKVWKQDCLVLSVHVQRLEQNEGVYQGAALTVTEPADKLHVEIECDGHLCPDHSVNLEQSDSKEHHLTLTYTPILEAQIPESVAFSLHLPQMDPDTCKMEVPLNVLDFIRPCSVSVADFARQWSLCGKECHLQVARHSLCEQTAGSHTDCQQDMVHSLAHRLHISLVQSIGGEHILAGQWLSSAPQHPVLVHCQGSEPTAATLQLWIRTSSQILLNGIRAVLG